MNGDDRGRNSARKDNEFFSFDWRLGRPFQFGGRYEITPVFEMFNTFNNANNINPLTHAGVVQLRRLPALRRWRPAAVAARGQGDVLRRVTCILISRLETGPVPHRQSSHGAY